jgi:toxin FitB
VSDPLGTNVGSELRKRRPAPAVIRWFEAAPPSSLYLSCLTIGEIRLGIERLRYHHAEAALAIEDWLGRLRGGYGDRVVAVDAGMAETWARINASRQLPGIDGLRAATALARDWTLVTRNTRHLTPLRRAPAEPLGRGLAAALGHRPIE